MEVWLASGRAWSVLLPIDCISAVIKLALQDHIFTGLTCQAFSHALAMCGLAVFGARRMQASPLRQPEQQLAAFLTYMGLTPLPTHEQILAGSAGLTAASRQEGGVHHSAEHSLWYHDGQICALLAVPGPCCVFVITESQ